MEHIAFKVNYNDIKTFVTKTSKKTQEELRLNNDEFKSLLHLYTYLKQAINVCESEYKERVNIGYPLKETFSTIAMLYKIVQTDDIILMLSTERLLRDMLVNELV